METLKKLRIVSCTILLSAMLGLALPAHAAEEFVLIVNSDNPVASLESKQVAKLFIKRVTEWEDGTKAAPVDQAPSSAIRQAFSEAVHGRSVTAVKSYWQKQIFSGRGVPPPELSNDAAVIDYVMKNRGGIGYVSPGANLQGVKVIDIR